ncbi:putative RNA-directed DNA polymerase from transposon BS [Portunus trituberculatus]|uniref:Putative RNA-directed DNA polymerase from transposon BS n=1 Tax=Portunus trituberculatus TaxID=210409 RepID=A0A5B7IB61_PORTR|nr:putative RNA-directed DNA polymerase from transposon BS [Portunus trituberculatus]
MEQLVALPFQDGTVLLSYADDLALVVTGRGNKLRRTQQALDLISEKCEELGLKISAEKSWAMMVKAADPAWQLRVQGVELTWTNSYQYLRVWVDKRLSFTAHAACLRERTQARLNVMRAMTRPTAGATFSVLRLYYVQAVRSLVDYSAPILVALSPNQQERFEVVQNTAMRTMHRDGLAPAVQQVMACRVARVLHRDAEGVAQRRLRLALVQDDELLRRNPWLLRVQLAVRSIVRIKGWPWPQADLPAPTCRAPTPWEIPDRRLHRHVSPRQQVRVHHRRAAPARPHGHGPSLRARLNRAGGHPAGPGARPPPSGAYCGAAHRLQVGPAGPPAAALSDNVGLVTAILGSL